jgi:hypothetical protein|tara:strand:+ start:1872 stop:2087 length:216 start_codon:yes stop_codon:yes gene_type:complete
MPKNKKCKLRTFSIPADLDNKLIEYSDYINLSVSANITRMLTEYMRINIGTNKPKTREDLHLISSIQTQFD